MGLVRETFAALMLSKCCRARAAQGHAAAGLRCPETVLSPRCAWVGEQPWSQRARRLDHHGNHEAGVQKIKANPTGFICTYLHTLLH